jgi:hypothetical protein
MRFLMPFAVLFVLACSSGDSGGSNSSCSPDGTWALTLSSLDGAPQCPKFPMLKRVRVNGNDIAVTYVAADGTETLDSTCFVINHGSCAIDIECDFPTYKDVFPVDGDPNPLNQHGAVSRSGPSCATIGDIAWSRIN